MKRQEYNTDSVFQTIGEASRTTGLSRYYLRNGCKDGTIPHIMCGNTYMVNVPLTIEKLNDQSVSDS